MINRSILLLALTVCLLPCFSFAQPVISIDPMSVESDLLVGEFEEFVITINNEGNQNLNWIAIVELVAGPDEVEGVEWLRLDPVQGVVVPEADVNLVGVINGFGLVGGDYEAEIHIQSNDPENPDLAVSVVVHFTPAPDIRVNWPEEAGFPDVIDLNDVFPEIWVGVECAIELKVINAGDEDLSVEDVISDNGVFRADPSQFVCARRDTQNVTLSCNADEPGLKQGQLTIVSNDPSEGEIQIDLRAEVFLPPEMGVDNDSLDVEIEDHTVTKIIKISNSGAYELRWTSELTRLGGNQQDSAAIRITVDPASGSIQPSAYQDVSVMVDCLEDRTVDQAYELVIRSNDPELPEFSIDVTISHTSGIPNPPFDLAPGNHLLSSCYPNPFNSSTTIGMVIPSRADARVIVFNATGRERRVLFEGVREAGAYQITFDAADLPAGVYLIQAEAGGRIEQIKTVLVR